MVIRANLFVIKIDLFVTIVGKLKCVLESLFDLFIKLVSIIFIARQTFIFYKIVLDTFIFKETITTLEFNFMNSFC